MKNSENLRKLLQAMNTFDAAYNALMVEIYKYEQATGKSVNDVPGFDKYYPFDTSLDELPISRWVTCVVDTVRKSAFKVLNYEYMNTGGNCMVGIFTVWVPSLNQTVYVLANEEGCNLTTVDYISNDLDIDDYDELIIENVCWDYLASDNDHFELYRHCLNEYTKSDCRYFGCTRALPYRLLSDELQSEIHADYLSWLESNNYDVDTNGERIIVHPDFDSLFSDPHEDGTVDEEDGQLSLIKSFKEFHDTTAGNEEFYSEDYVLTFAGRTIRLPFIADVWDAINTVLETTIENW